MIMRETAPRVLSVAGVLVVALLLPLVPSLAQAPAPGGPPPAQAQPAFPDSTQQAIRNAQADIERMQADLQRLQAELQRKQRQLQDALERFKKGDGQTGKKPELGPPPITGKGGDPAPKTKTPFGGMGPPAGKAGVPDRLQEVEKKLDLLLWEIQNLRREMQGPRGGPPKAGLPGGAPRFPGGPAGQQGLPSLPGTSPGEPLAPGLVPADPAPRPRTPRPVPTRSAAPELPAATPAP